MGQRAAGLSRQQIVDAAVEILDSEGESALTFRALAARLHTGSGAIHWHVADKTELLSAATSLVVGRVPASHAAGRRPEDAVRVLADGVFGAVSTHPWVGSRLAHEPWQPAVFDLFEQLGQRVGALGVPEEEQFNAATALLHYFLGLASQYAAVSRHLPSDLDRGAVLEAQTAQWLALDAVDYPFLHRVAPGLSKHDDREQFLAGVDLIVTGLLRSRASVAS